MASLALCWWQSISTSVSRALRVHYLNGDTFTLLGTIMDDITTPSMSTELEDSAPEIMSRSIEDIETHNQSLPNHEVCTDMEENSISTAGVHASGVDEAMVSINLTEEERSKLMTVMAKAKVNS